MLDKIKDILKNINLLYVGNSSEKQLSIITLLQLLCENVHITYALDDAMRQCKLLDPEIVVIDIEMLEFDGVGFIQRLRQKNAKSAVIVLTDNLYDTAALQGYVQQILVKPFDSEALVAGLKASAEHLIEQECLDFPVNKRLFFDSTNSMLMLNEQTIHLTPKEKKLLELLSRNRQRIVTYNEIEHYVWKDQSMSMGSLKSIVNKIRTKIGMSDIIRNYSNEGYKLTQDMEIDKTL